MNQDDPKRLKVAFITYQWPEYCLRLIGALAQKTEICLLAPRPWGEHIHRLEQTIQFKPFDKPRFRQPWKQLQAIYRMVRTVKTFHPDVIHLQHGHLWFNLALPLLKQYPLVVTIHDPRYHVGDRESQKTPQPIIDFGFRRATRIIVHTPQMAELVVKELSLPANRIDIVPHIQLGDDAAQKEVPEDGHQILFFGRIWEYKGLEYLIKAEPFITAQIPEAKIVIAGRGEAFDRYREMMVHPEQFIIHNEYISDEKRTELFRRASIVVLPYIEATQSGVIPVAYTFEKPVVTTVVGGLPDQVEDGRTGLLVPPRDEQALAHAIIRLIQDRTLRHRLGAQGKQKLETEWSAEAVGQQTLPVYYRAIQVSRHRTMEPLQNRERITSENRTD